MDQKGWAESPINHEQSFDNETPAETPKNQASQKDSALETDEEFKEEPHRHTFNFQSFQQQQTPSSPEPRPIPAQRASTTSAGGHPFLTQKTYAVKKVDESVQEEMKAKSKAYKEKMKRVLNSKLMQMYQQQLALVRQKNAEEAKSSEAGLPAGAIPPPPKGIPPPPPLPSGAKTSKAEEGEFNNGITNISIGKHSTFGGKHEDISAITLAQQPLPTSQSLDTSLGTELKNFVLQTNENSKESLHTKQLMLNNFDQSRDRNASPQGPSPSKAIPVPQLDQARVSTPQFQNEQYAFGKHMYDSNGERQRLQQQQTQAAQEEPQIKIQTQQEKLEKFLQKTIKNKFSNHFGAASLLAKKRSISRGSGQLYSSRSPNRQGAADPRVMMKQPNQQFSNYPRGRGTQQRGSQGQYSNPNSANGHSRGVSANSTSSRDRMMKQGSSRDTLQAAAQSRPKEPSKMALGKAPHYLKGTKSTQNAAALTERLKNAPVSPDRFGTKIMDKKKKPAVSPAPKVRPTTARKPTRVEELKEEPQSASLERGGGTAKKKSNQKFLSKNTKKKPLNRDIDSGGGQERTQIIYHGPAEPYQSVSHEQTVFKQQFQQYLEVLKNQISLMDVQIKDTLTQRDHYKAKCEELQAQVQAYQASRPGEGVNPLIFEQLRTKDEVIESLKESLNTLSAYNQSISRSQLHRSESQGEMTTDEAERQFEGFLTYDPSKRRLKSFYSVTQFHKFGLSIPKIPCLQEASQAIHAKQAPADIMAQIQAKQVPSEVAEQFTSFLAKKLQVEETNRLKTEEQSAMVIEQLGQTISRMDVDKQQRARLTGAISTSNISEGSLKKSASPSQRQLP